MPEPERLGRPDLDAAAALLARAFSDEPVLDFLLGPERERERELIFTALCRDVLGAGRLEGMRAEGGLASVAVWMPPGRIRSRSAARRGWSRRGSGS